MLGFDTPQPKQVTGQEHLRLISTEHSLGLIMGTRPEPWALLKKTLPSKIQPVTVSAGSLFPMLFTETPIMVSILLTAILSD